MIKDFKELLDRFTGKEKKRIAVAMAQDSEVLQALDAARAAGIAESILVGDQEKIEHIAGQIHIDLAQYEIINEPDEHACVAAAVRVVKAGDAQVLMKGLCSTAVFLKGILNKENGLRSAKLLSHLAIFDSPHYHKLLFMSDAAMNIAPDINEKIAITENAIRAANRLGYEAPKVALISAVEKVNASGMPSSAEAAVIAKMGERGQIKNAVIDGPLAVDNALSHHANEVKGLRSPVGGDADICIVPNIETGNVFYKLLTILGGAQVAGVILGASVPVVLTSRADSDSAKFLSIASALAIS